LHGILSISGYLGESFLGYFLVDLQGTFSIKMTIVDLLIANSKPNFKEKNLRVKGN
jgi:hypothetical protein